MITLDKELTFQQFRREMQHRVSRYPLHGPEVQEALEFARTHPNERFYRVASEKFHSQLKFQQENPLPSILQQLRTWASVLLPKQSFWDTCKVLGMFALILASFQYFNVIDLRPRDDNNELEIKLLAEILGLTDEGLPNPFPVDPTLNQLEETLRRTKLPMRLPDETEKPLSDRELDEQIKQLLQYVLLKRHSQQAPSHEPGKVASSQIPTPSQP